jgi:hypothetical protein
MFVYFSVPRMGWPLMDARSDAGGWHDRRGGRIGPIGVQWGKRKDSAFSRGAAESF